MGARHLLLLLVYLEPLGAKPKPAPNRSPKVRALNGTAAPAHETCLGYYDVSGQFDKMFECNNTDHRYCCGTCYLRFCCQFKGNRLEQRTCKNYQKPAWVKTVPPSPVPTGDAYDPSMDQTNAAVYITCGVIAFIIVLGVSAKVAYDKATQPPPEMNIHRALADILRQQGPIPISQYDCENFAAMNSSPKDNTPVRTGSKNHYTPVHASKSNHGGHYAKESSRSGGHDLHNFISSGFVTLGRGHVKGEKHWPVRSQSHHGTHQHSYNPLGISSPTRTPQNDNTRMSGILTSQTEPYDLSFSRSFQSLSHLPPSYEAAVKADLNKFSSLKKLTDKDMDDYYSRKRHLPDLAARGTLPLHVLKMAQDGPTPQLAPPQQQPPLQQSSQRQRPRRVQRAMSQDRVLSPERSQQQDYVASPYGTPTTYGSRILSDEQLLSAERLRSHERLFSHNRHFSQDRLHSHERLYSQDRLHSQDPLLSPDRMASIKRSGFHADRSMSRAISHTDVFVPSTPTLDRYKMAKVHAHPSSSGNAQHNSHSVNQTASKRQAFASRRTQTLEHFQYVPGHHHHYRTGSKTEVTV
ncbi:protein shisa-6-like isoform X2 [Denticeps clupeoides]|uniref:protein shisa-6-like isoform X2 n=1 Tax=Denticeps clupeoides TaxID=299321 RepID=UPI0010A2AE1E|nr:protein shisa-6-like isoform X2 [Denticeps clupeoides]